MMHPIRRIRSNRAVRSGRAARAVVLGALLFLLGSTPAMALGPADLVQIGAAFLTHVAVHESGHYVMAHMGGAQDVDLDFFSQYNGSFYLGVSRVQGINRQSALPYKIAGEAAASYHFEVALRQYRMRPTTFNRSLLFFSGTDFLWYTLYAFYLADNKNPSYDPIGIVEETGLSPEALLGMVSLQTAVNFYRVLTGNDSIIPYLALDQYSAEFGLQIRY